MNILVFNCGSSSLTFKLFKFVKNKIDPIFIGKAHRVGVKGTEPSFIEYWYDQDYTKYSFLLEEDQDYLIGKIHTDEKTSLVMIDEIKNQISKIPNIDWFSVQCSNHGMLHSYSTVIGTEKSWWVPFSGLEDSEL